MSAQPKEEKPHKVTRFTSSKRFIKAANATFDAVDLDNSGSLEIGEVFCAILLLQHRINAFPLLGRQEPFTREQVVDVMTTFAKKAPASLTREEFLKAAQSLCSEMAASIFKHVVATAILAPLLAKLARAVLERTVVQAAPVTGKVVPFVGEGLFVGLAAATVEVATRPVLGAKGGRVRSLAPAGAK